MINEFIMVAKSLERTGCNFSLSINPVLSQVNTGCKLGRIDNECNLVLVDSIEEEIVKKLYKFHPVKTGCRSFSFPIIKIFDKKTKKENDINKSKNFFNEFKSSFLSDFINKLSPYEEANNMVKIATLVYEKFDYERFINQYIELTNDKSGKLVCLYLDFQEISSGYYVSNTETWNKLMPIINKVYPETGDKNKNGICWYSNKENILANTDKLKVLASKSLFDNGLSIYSKNISACKFPITDKVQISQSLWKEVSSAAEWILSDKRVNKNSYCIEKSESDNTVLVCYLEDNPVSDIDFAKLLIENVDNQENAADEIQKIFKSIMITGMDCVSTEQKLSFFIIQRVSIGTFQIQGEGVVSIEKLQKSISKWYDCNKNQLFFKNKKTIGLKDVWKVCNSTVNTVSFSDIFIRIFLDTDKQLCQRLIEILLNLYYREIISMGQSLHNNEKVKNIDYINNKLLTFNVLLNIINY